MKKTLITLVSILFVFVAMFAGLAGWKLYPHQDLQAIPAPLVSYDSDEGKALLESADIRTDYSQLSKTFESQNLTSYCGVASSVMVLNAMGKNVSQDDFFTDKTSNVLSQLNVVFRGMSLPQLAGLLEAHGVQTSVHYADESSVDEFRRTIENNLAKADDYLVVNYLRKSLGQGDVGHISPLAAYNRSSDSVLIMDTTSNNYPPTWVPVEMLYTAMMTTDSASGRMRGYIEIFK